MHAYVQNARPAELSGLLHERLTALSGRHQVPGAQVAVHVDGRTHLAHTGTASVLTGKPFTQDTAVPVGSVTKTCTAALVMLLVADGDVGLDDPMSAYLPELSGAADFTVRHALSHTAGLPSGPESDAVLGWTATRYLSACCGRQHAVAAPGVMFSYSNAGYVAAGRLVEEVTGMPWPEALGTWLLEPLGVGPALLGDPTPRRPLADGHSAHPVSGRVRSVQQTLAPVEAPAGAVLASAADLAALGRAVLGADPDGPLPPDSAREMRRAAPASDAGVLGDAWGMGLAVFRRDGRTWYGHDGNALGTSCYLRADPSDGVVVALTTNANSGAALWRDLAGELGDLLGLFVPSAPEPRARGQAVRRPECAGTYRNGSLTYEVVCAADGSLTLSVGGETPAPLLPYDDWSCDLLDPTSGSRLPGGRFLPDPDTGTVVALQISGRLARRG